VPDDAPQPEARRRYDRFAAALHWLTAALLVVQIAVGFVFHAMDRGPVRSEWFTWHKTLGVTILLLALVRLGWRLGHRPPPFPSGLPRWQRRIALWNHRLLYFVLIALPLTGLIAVSAYTGQDSIALAGGLSLPPIPGVPEGVGEIGEEVHKNLVLLTVALIALHLAAALWHRFERRRLMTGRMPPFRGRGTP
jgi:cytochrome b561